jgi:hypothetical protein
VETGASIEIRDGKGSEPGRSLAKTVSEGMMAVLRSMGREKGYEDGMKSSENGKMYYLRIRIHSPC